MPSTAASPDVGAVSPGSQIEVIRTAPEPGQPQQRHASPAPRCGGLADDVLGRAEHERRPARVGADGASRSAAGDVPRDARVTVATLAHVADVRDKLKGLPAKPGVYLFRDDEGDVLYVGKAKSLRPRVRSYFQAGRGDSRASIPRLVRARSPTSR